MRILFFSHYFPPEVNAPATRTFEHCRLWAKAGHDVHVVTCVPSHPRGVPFDGHRRTWYRRDSMEGITVHRVWTYLAPNRGFLRRTLNYLSFVPSAVFRALRLGRFDVIIATSPQFFCAVAGGVAGALSRTPWIFELRDLWPESIAAVGALPVSHALRAVERLELRLYRHARAIVCLTHAFMNNLARRGIDPTKLHFLPNGTDEGFWSEGRRTVGRSRLCVTDDQLVVSYIGTVGMAHSIGTILDAARLMRDTHPAVRFVVVGDGAELDAIQRRAQDSGLVNVQFTGLVDRQTARDCMAASDIALVLLRRSPLFETVLPSKMFEAMAAGKPVVLGVQGEARHVLEASGGGIAVAPEDATALADAIGKLARSPDRRTALGLTGRAYVAREFNRTALAARYLQLLEQLVGNARAPLPQPRAGSAAPATPVLRA
jgi:glycosyltransferase involved in cell wall biosynthesis